MKIHQLTEEVAAKIAAGEVIERPVSVVKELLENALDAGSSEIKIRVDQAGFKRIEIEDNGFGIDREDVRLALKRYATSKISDLSDLERIDTLGFRGEALASIAAVSRFSIATNNVKHDGGINLYLEGGMEKSSTSISMNRGTKILVQDLFFNTPVRRKFLKKEITERRLISELVSRYAINYASIRMQLEHDGKIALLTSGNDNQIEVISQIYDIDTAKRMLYVDYLEKDMHIKGYCSPTNITRSSRKDIFFFINGRLVSDASLTSAVIKAYQGLLMVARYPISALFIEIPPSHLDVNIHPAKAEVRFQDPGSVFNLVHSSLRKTILLHSPPAQFSPGMWRSDPLPSGKEIDPAWGFSGDQKYWERASTQTSMPETSESSPSSIIRLPILRPIGQIGRKYIVTEGPDGIYLIDQHAAHERILYEKLAHIEKGDEKIAQYFLEPILIELSGTTDEQLKNLMPLLKSMGFQLREFGHHSYLLETMPTLLQHLEPKEALLSAIEPDAEEDLISSEKSNKVISRICKKAAIKAGQVLSFEEQEKLVRDLENCQSPRTCPHGRPTMIHISVDLLERQFGRRGSV